MQRAGESRIEQRLKRVEDRFAIQDLVAAYGFAVDDRDVDGLARLFTADGRFRSMDGVLDARGREAVIEQFHGRFAVLGPTHHFTHDHQVWFDQPNPGEARGRLSAHAEVVRHGQTLVTALRYDDHYRNEDGHWRFADRLLSFLYYVPAEQYADALRAPDRMRVYETPAAADWPEALPSWREYYSKHPGPEPESP